MERLGVGVLGRGQEGVEQRNDARGLGATLLRLREKGGGPQRKGEARRGGGGGGAGAWRGGGSGRPA
jgi:hypothetical protein